VVRELRANDVVECSENDDVGTDNETMVVVVVVVVVVVRPLICGAPCFDEPLYERLYLSHLLFNLTSEIHECTLLPAFWTLLVQATSRGLCVRAIRGFASDHACVASLLLVF